jgi:integrase
LPEVVDLLARWRAESDPASDDHLVFPGSGKDGHYVYWKVLNALYAAMDKAGIPRECPEGRARGVRRTFHSFRHTFVKLALESGCSLAWLSRQLGHSGTHVTDQVYGHFGRQASRREAKSMIGVFNGV